MKCNPKAKRETEVPTKVTTWLLKTAFGKELNYTSRLSDTSKIKILFDSHSCITPSEDVLISNAV